MNRCSYSREIRIGDASFELSKGKFTDNLKRRNERYHRIALCVNCDVTHFDSLEIEYILKEI